MSTRLNQSAASSSLAATVAAAFELDQRAAELFTVLLQLGRATVQQLAAAARRERTGTYDVLRRLIQADIVVQVPTATRGLFAVAAPDRIRALYAERLARVDALLPQIAAQYERSSGALRTTTDEGEGALISAMSEVAMLGSSVLRLLVPSVELAAPLATALGSVLAAATAELRIALPSPSFAAQWVVPRTRQSSVVRRVLATRSADPAGLLIADRAVVYFVVEPDQLRVIAMQSPTVARVHEQLFDRAWATGRSVRD